MVKAGLSQVLKCALRVSFAFFLTRQRPLGVTTTGALGYMARLTPARKELLETRCLLDKRSTAGLSFAPRVSLSHQLLLTVTDLLGYREEMYKASNHIIKSHFTGLGRRLSG